MSIIPAIGIAGAAAAAGRPLNSERKPRQKVAVNKAPKVAKRVKQVRKTKKS